MATLLYVGSYGSDDPTRAVLPLLSARGAVEAGHQGEVFLVGEAVYLMRDMIADSLNPVGWPNVGEVLRDVVAKGVNFFV